MYAERFNSHNLYGSTIIDDMILQKKCSGVPQIMKL